MTVPELTAHERGLVAATWDYRANAERSAELRFRRLAQALEDVGAEDVVISLAHDAVDDEARHAVLCAEVATAYGWEPCDHTHTPEAPELAPEHFTPRDAVLYEIVAFCCLTETLNAAMLADTLRFAQEPLIQDAVRTILRDEVSHSRMGWAHLEAERRQGRGDFLSAELPGMFAEAGIPEIFDENDNARESEAIAAHGELSYARRTTIFRDAVSGLVLAGWEAAGLDTSGARAWLAPFGV